MAKRRLRGHPDLESARLAARWKTYGLSHSIDRCFVLLQAGYRRRAKTCLRTGWTAGAIALITGLSVPIAPLWAIPGLLVTSLIGTTTMVACLGTLILGNELAAHRTGRTVRIIEYAITLRSHSQKTDVRSTAP